MLKALIVAAAMGGCAGGAPALPLVELDRQPTSTETGGSTEPCQENWGDGQVQIKWENTMSCDLVPPQELIVIIDELSWEAHTGSTEGWGGDDSQHWALQEILDGGGRADFKTGDDWVIGWNMDY